MNTRKIGVNLEDARVYMCPNIGICRSSRMSHALGRLQAILNAELKLVGIYGTLIFIYCLRSTRRPTRRWPYARHFTWRWRRRIYRFSTDRL